MTTPQDPVVPDLRADAPLAARNPRRGAAVFVPPPPPPRRRVIGPAPAAAEPPAAPAAHGPPVPPPNPPAAPRQAAADPTLDIPPHDAGPAGTGDDPPGPPEPPNTRPAGRPAKPRRRRSRGFGLFRLLFVLGAAGLLAAGVGGYGLYRSVAADLPDYTWLASYQPPQMSRIYAADSRLLAELATERRVFVPIEAIPRRLQQAFVAAEDQRFWDHHGVDPIGMLRAVLTYVEQYGSGRRMGGASTITQQVAKNMLVGADRSITRKLREAILATRIEQTFSKERILELYLNEIFLGAQAYGVAAAAQAYFNKGLDELSVAEMAFLAALPKAPNNYNPQRFPEAARIRRDWVLDRMAEDGVITAQEQAFAKAEPILGRPNRRPDIVPVGQFFTEDVRRELISRFGPEQTTTGGLVVRTSLDPALQAATETALRNGLTAYDRRRGGWRGPVARIAATATEWLPQLDALPRPAGALPEWRVAVALEVRDRDARLGWVERGTAQPTAPAAGIGAPQPRTGQLLLEDAAWARAALRDQRLGPPPRRLQDVLAVGDVVLVEVLAGGAAGPAGPRGAPPGPRQERLALRQVPQVEGAVVALDPATGRVLAMAGGWSFDRSQYNRSSQAMRQPGSSFKPFVYITALEQGIPPNQRYLDGPIEVNTGQGMWRPTNYGGGTGAGAYVTMRSALERSLNLVTIRIAQEVTMERVADTANRFGVIPNMPRYLSMALGAGETTVLRQAAAYAGFANGGRQVTPSLIDSVQDQRGRVIWRSEALRCPACETAFTDGAPPPLVDQRRQITDPIAAYQMVNLLTGVVQRGTGVVAGRGINRPIAGKTGTSNDEHDNWFVGFTPDIVIAVWMGFDEPRSLGNNETGGSNAAPIFRDVLEAALRGSPTVPFRAPPGVALVRITTDSGATILEAFRPGTENSARPPGEDVPGGNAANVDAGLGGLY